jgi:hypothetical protein
VTTGNPSACATVYCKVCKSAIVLYCLYLNVIKRERESVTQVSINPIIRTRIRLISRMYHPTRDSIINENTSRFEFAA